MKTFYEWLELNEAGLFSGWFGGNKPQRPQMSNQETPEEKERRMQAQRHDDAMRMLVPDYKPHEPVANASGPSPAAAAVRPGSAPTVRAQASKSPGQFAGGDNYEHLHHLLGDVPLLKKAMDNKESKDSNQVSRLLDLFRNLSYVKTGYRPSEIPEVSKSNIDKSYDIVEKMLSGDFALRSYPDKEVVMPYEDGDWNWEDYAALDDIASGEGPWEANPRPALVVSKGFKRGAKRVSKAFVSVKRG